jgi:hypothetical protein
VADFGIRQDEGADRGYDSRYAPIPPKREEGSGSEGAAIASLVVGLLGMTTACIPFLGVAVGVLGIVLGIKGREAPQGAGVAVAGIVVSAMCLVLSLAFTVFWVMGTGSGGGCFQPGST